MDTTAAEARIVRHIIAQVEEMMIFPIVISLFSDIAYSVLSFDYSKEIQMIAFVKRFLPITIIFSVFITAYLEQGLL